MEEIVTGILNKYPKNSRENLIPVLQEIQNEAGYISNEILVLVGRYLQIPLNQVYGVATFYDEFRFLRKGTYHIKVCDGTACHISQPSGLLSEIEKIIFLKPGQTSRDGKFSLEVVSCLGACSKAAVLSINDTFYSNITPEYLQRLLTALQ